MAKRAKKPDNYIDNKTFYKYLIEFQEKCKLASEAGEERPQTPNRIGECIYQIANRLATKPNFSGYPFKHEMICDGIENACDAVLKFNSEKSQNPFAYFTQIIWYAFLRRIEREKKQLLVKKLYFDHIHTNKEAFDTTLMTKYGATAPGWVGSQTMQSDYMEDLHKEHEKKEEQKKEDKQKEV